ncbi:DUF397 domain-containing protein [Streptomyces sp. S.PB5]|uniref:DUF397 domain-containing protein n=1 Tax=Streptomyces sp. S.PB5 TaxID=3020844 RepID=UPI0025AF7942|nr:DUF397 domain-containing protein [Streptomyces sp. S.PB5]MDN3028818.1 DUF397 domain-containing protein [Streptomyces sp. S.PB5]
MNLRWQKSSYCSEGASCIHVAAGPTTVHLTESSDPTEAILTATPATFTTFLTTLKHEPPLPHPTIHITHAAETVRIHTTDTTVTTAPAKWEAFVLGVKAGEFDHFAAVGS